MTTHVHYHYDGSDCDGRLERSAVHLYADKTIDEVLREIIENQYHVGPMHPGSVASTVMIGRHDDEYEAQRKIEILPIVNFDVATDENDEVIIEDGEVRHQPIVEQWQITTHAPHEEGGSTEHYLVCDDPRCDVDEPASQRDYSAEAMGY